MRVKVVVENTGDPREKVKVFKCVPGLTIRDFLKKVKGKLLNPPLRNRDGKVLLKNGKELKSKKIKDTRMVKIVDDIKKEDYNLSNLKLYKNTPLITFYNKLLRRMKTNGNETKAHNDVFVDVDKSGDSSINFEGPLGSKLSFTLKRTLRLPENSNKPPPDLGSIPVYMVSRYKSTVPSRWKEDMNEKTFFIPLYEDETFFLKMDGNTPHAVKVENLGTNNDTLSRSDTSQNYFVFPKQETINGFVNEEEGNVTQFLPEAIPVPPSVSGSSCPPTQLPSSSTTTTGEEDENTKKKKSTSGGLTLQAFPICSTGNDNTSFRMKNGNGENLSLYKSYSDQVNQEEEEEEEDEDEEEPNERYIFFETGFSSKLRRNTLLDVISSKETDTTTTEPEFKFRYRLITLYFRPFPTPTRRPSYQEDEDDTSCSSSDDDESDDDEDEDSVVEVLTIPPSTPYKTLLKRLRDRISVVGPLHLYSYQPEQNNNHNNNKKIKKKREKKEVLQRLKVKSKDMKIFQIPYVGDRVTLYYKLGSSSRRSKKKKNIDFYRGKKSGSASSSSSSSRTTKRHTDISMLQFDEDEKNKRRRKDYNSILSKISDEVDRYNNNNNNNVQNRSSLLLFTTSSSSGSSGSSGEEKKMYSDDNSYTESDTDEEFCSTTRKRRKKRRRKRRKKKHHHHHHPPPQQQLSHDKIIPLPPIDYHLGNEIQMVRGQNMSRLELDTLTPSTIDPNLQFFNTGEEEEEVKIFICNQKMFRRVTGEKMPYPPLGKELYIEYGIPFFRKGKSKNTKKKEEEEYEDDMFLLVDVEDGMEENTDSLLEEYLLDKQKEEEGGK